MKTISLSDRLFATITLFGQTIANISVQGVTSMKEIMARLVETIGTELPRMSRLTLRNASQGWMFTSTIIGAPQASMRVNCAVASSAVSEAEATQLTLSF